MYSRAENKTLKTTVIILYRVNAKYTKETVIIISRFKLIKPVRVET